MAENRSNVSRYPSKYSPGGWVTSAQYIIELVCEQKGYYEKKELPLQFWKHKEWQQYFVSQTKITHQLLKKYDEKVIIKIIKEKRIRNLMPKWIKTVLNEEQKKFNIIKKQQEIEKETKPTNSTNKIDNLLAIDEEIDNA